MAKPKNETPPPETDEVLTSLAADLSALPALNRAEIDIQIATAKKYPRSITAFLRQALEMATLDEETAASMFYVLPRDGKRIEGPSIRLAEVVGSAWGNLRYGARMVEDTGTTVVAQGACFDLEKNVACSVEVSTRVTNRQGIRYSADMVNNTALASQSKALRNAIFRVVPMAYIKGILEQCKLVALGKGLTMEQQRGKAVAAFLKLDPRLTEAVLLKLLGRKGIEDVTTDDVIALRGFYTAVKDGELTVEEFVKQALREETPAGPRGSTLDTLAAGMGEGQTTDQPA